MLLVRTLRSLPSAHFAGIVVCFELCVLRAVLACSVLRMRIFQEL